jgi:UDP-N-acetyl-D-mannosaminuronic acid dehydrogenase
MQKIVIIGGCGHVGLPLGLVFANCGLDVVLLDRDQGKIDTVNGGQMPFMETNALELLGRVIGKQLIATADPSCLRDADAAIAVLGTPVDEHLNPTVTDLYRSIDEAIASMPENALLVLRSTVFPGVTKLVHDRLQASGRRIHLAFCPERIAEGKAMEEIQTLPQIISAFDPDSLARVRELFSIINEDLIELTPLEAELAKLFTNSWRYMNFAISNQFYMLAETYGHTGLGAISMTSPQFSDGRHLLVITRRGMMETVIAISDRYLPKDAFAMPVAHETFGFPGRPRQFLTGCS